jgi:hypothetical protein
LNFLLPILQDLLNKRLKTSFRFSFDPDTSPANGPKKWPLANFSCFLGDPPQKSETLKKKDVDLNLGLKIAG